MKRNKKICSLLTKTLSLLLILSLLFEIISISPLAAAQNVTKSKSQSMDDIINEISFLPSINLFSGKKKLVYNNSTKSIIGAALYTYSVSTKTTVAKSKAGMASLFGSSKGFKISKSTIYPYSMFTQKGQTIYYNGGKEWGYYNPMYEIKKIMKTGSSTYTATVNYYFENENGLTYIGNFTYKLKESKNSYGYIITGFTQNTKCGYQKLVDAY